MSSGHSRLYRFTEVDVADAISCVNNRAHMHLPLLPHALACTGTGAAQHGEVQPGGSSRYIQLCLLALSKYNGRIHQAGYTMVVAHDQLSHCRFDSS